MKYIKICINSEKYKLYYPRKNVKTSEVIVICNGITTKKYRRKITKIIDCLLKKNYSIVTFDYVRKPRFGCCYKNKLDLNSYMKKLDNLCSFIKDKYPSYKINIFSTGFGAYVTLNSIAQNDLNINKIVLNTPVIDLKELFKVKLAKYNLIDFYKINPKCLNDGKMKEIKTFYNEISRVDLLSPDNKFNNVFIICDKKEAIVDINDITKFISNSKDSKLFKCNDLNRELLLHVNECF